MGSGDGWLKPSYREIAAEDVGADDGASAGCMAGGGCAWLRALGGGADLSDYGAAHIWEFDPDGAVDGADMIMLA